MEHQRFKSSCFSPFSVKNKKNQTQPVPCGKCINCLKRRVSGWSFRLMQQDKISKCSLFITLTYDTKYVPISKNGFMSLSKRDLQLFFKRLRKAHEGTETTIKYYACGEYGEESMRPHYHVILFDADIQKISPAWDRGNVHYGLVSEASVGYTLKYMTKKPKIPMHRNDDREREFPLMSKGLGLNYLTPAAIKWHKANPNERMYLNLTDGKKISMPRYYKEKLYIVSHKQEVLNEKGIFQGIIKVVDKSQLDAIASFIRNKNEKLLKEQLAKDEYYFAKEAIEKDQYQKALTAKTNYRSSQRNKI